MITMTFLQFKQKLRSELWPAGEARSLRVPHDSYFVAAMMDLQRWVECLRQKNITQFPFCSTYWEDAKTVVDCPKGEIQSVYTVMNDDWRDKVPYWSSNFRAIKEWASWLYGALTPENSGMPKLPFGYRYAEAAVDSTIGRARTGEYAIHNRRLYIAPWIQSKEILVVEWQGKKQDWKDDDVLDIDDWNVTVQEAVKFYVRSRHETDWGDPALGNQFQAQYIDKRADIMYDCRQETRQVQEIPDENHRPIRAADVTDEDPSTQVEPSTDYKVCFIADHGRRDTPLEENAAQIAVINPNAVLFGGDNTYDDVAYETVFGDLFSAWQTDDQSTNRLFAIPGNHDIDFDSTFAEFYSYFAGNKNNKRYFSFVVGPMHFFCISTDSREPDSGYVDATTPITDGVMMKWLRASLAISTAKYKIVVGHHGPFMSDENNTPGNKWLDVPFKDWGAHLYIGGHGHNFEHSRKSGFDYLVCGLGGHSIRNFGADNDADSIIKQFNSDYAFLSLTGSCSKLQIDLITRAGENPYTYEITV
jgi:hypothetical protein